MSNIQSLVHFDVKTEFEKDVECQCLLRCGPVLFPVLAAFSFSIQLDL